MLLPETGRFLLFPAPVCVQRCPSRAGRDPAEPRGGGSLGHEGVRPQGLRSRGCLPVRDLGPRARRGRCPWSPGGQACPELAGLTESTTFLGSTQALKGEAARPGISSRRHVQLPEAWGTDKWHRAGPPPVTSWVSLMGLAFLWQSGHFLGGRGHPPGLLLCPRVCPRPLRGWGGWRGLVLTVCPSAAVHCPRLVLGIPAVHPRPERTAIPLPGVLPGALPGEAAALGAGPAGLAESP